jgi:hypothetical protein
MWSHYKYALLKPLVRSLLNLLSSLNHSNAYSLVDEVSISSSVDIIQFRHTVNLRHENVC